MRKAMSLRLQSEHEEQIMEIKKRTGFTKNHIIREALDFYFALWKRSKKDKEIILDSLKKG